MRKGLDALAPATTADSVTAQKPLTTTNARETETAMSGNTMTLDLITLGSALADFANVFGDGAFAFDNGCHYTCNEADAIAALLVAAGFKDAAITWLEGHAEGDEDEVDFHRLWEDNGTSTQIDIPAYVESLAA